MLALRRVLEVLATNHPKWLRNIILPHWYTRYHLFMAAPDLPQTIPEQAGMVETIGADIQYLFRRSHATTSPAGNSRGQPCNRPGSAIRAAEDGTAAPTHAHFWVFNSGNGMGG
jgi:hypothetical protein